jgi:mRNA interferase MazF
VASATPKHRRGEVWWTNLSPVRGHEQAGRRPVLVVSDDAYNRSALSMAFVVPLTRTLRSWPSRVRIDPPEGGVTAPSELMCDQLRAVTAERLERRLGMVRAEALERVATILRLLLAI